MALAISPTGPPYLGTVAAATVTTASFTPPAGSLLLAFTNTQQAAGAGAAPTITSSPALTWNVIGVENVQNGLMSVSWAWVPASVAMTVTTTQAGTTTLQTGLEVVVLTGADPLTPIGANGVSSGNGNIISATYTPTRIGSMGLLANCDNAHSTTGTILANSTQFYWDNGAGNSGQNVFGASQTVAATDTITPLTYGYSTAVATSANNTVYLEVLPAPPVGPSLFRAQPRNRGPKAVGPTFFAPIQPAPVVAAAPLALSRTAADTSLSTDSAARLAGTPRSAADTTASSDAASRTVTQTRSVSSSVSTYAPTVLNDSPTAYWRMDDTGTTMADQVGSTPGTYNGGYTQSQPGLITDPDTATSFNGSTGYVAVPHTSALDLGDLFTLECWIEISAYPTTLLPVILANGTGSYVLRLNNTSSVLTTGTITLRKGATGDIATTTVQLTLNTPHHFVVTKNGSSVHLYIDGIDVTGAITNQTIVNNTAGMTIAASNNGSNTTGVVPFLPGTLDEIALYNYEMTPARVAYHYAVGVGGGGDYSPHADVATRLAPIGRSAADTSVSTDIASATTPPSTRSTTDATLSTDATAIAWAGSRSGSDTSTTSDASVRTRIGSRSSSDASVSTDSSTRASAVSRTSADTSTSSAAVTRILVESRITADTSSTSDAATRLDVYGRSSADTTTTTDAATRGSSRSRTSSDTSASSDASTRSWITQRTVSDLTISTDLATRGSVTQRSASDASTATDAATRTWIVSRTSGDTSITSDAISQGAGVARTASDTSLSTAVVTRAAQAFTITAADASTSTDLANSGRANARTVADTSLSSALVTSAPELFARSTSDTSTSTSTASGARVFARISADSTVTTDAASRLNVETRTATVTSLSSDVASAQGTRSRVSSDVSASTDAAARIKTSSRATSDTSTTAVSVTQGFRYARAASDTSTASDSLQLGLILHISLTDASLSTQTATRTLTKSFSPTDTTLSAVAVTRVTRLPRSPTDTTLSTDVAITGASGGHTRSSGDTSVATDVATRVLLQSRVSSGAYRDMIVNDAPNAYWRLDELSGTTMTDQMGTSSGVYNGGVTLGASGLTPGDTDPAVRFDGSTSYVAVPHTTALDVGDVFTIEMWVKISANPTLNPVLITNSAGSFVLRLNSTGTITLRKAATGDIAATTIPLGLNVAHHVVATKNGSGVHLYIDAVDVTGTITNQTVTNNTVGATIAASNNGSSTAGVTPFINGVIDEIAIYNYALTPAQVAAHASFAGGDTSRSTDVATRASGTHYSASDTSTSADTVSYTRTKTRTAANTSISTDALAIHFNVSSHFTSDVNLSVDTGQIKSLRAHFSASDTSTHADLVNVKTGSIVPYVDLPTQFLISTPTATLTVDGHDSQVAISSATTDLQVLRSGIATLAIEGDVSSLAVDRDDVELAVADSAVTLSVNDAPSELALDG